MTTAEIINQAVKMINEHDFFWFYADYEAAAREAARGHMQRKTCLRLTEKH